MELYILDGLLRRTEVVDQYDSLIWTERYADKGDIELVISSTPRTRTLLAAGQMLALNKSKRVMQVESIEDKDDDEGRSLLTIKGPSLEAITDDRAARNQIAPNAANYPGWTFQDLPANIARQIFQAICVNGQLDAKDIIPYIATGNMYTAPTMPEPSQVVRYRYGAGRNYTPPSTNDQTPELTADFDTVYNLIKNICDTFGLGFRLTRNYDNSQLFFNVYMGSDRTSNQTVLPPVIFSQAIGNVNNTSYLSTTAGFKNVAYVVGLNGSRIVYADGYQNVSGFDRHTLQVDASDITKAAGPDLDAALDARGKAELASYNTVQGMDGEITQYTGYEYEKDYFLGDLVEMRNPDGVTNQMMVTEQIFVQDDQGERAYPTLTTTLFIQPGAWYSGIGNVAWNDAPGQWADQ